MKNLTSKDFYKLHHTDRALDLVKRRDAGATWVSLEKQFGLAQHNGMSALRIYNWVKLRYVPRTGTGLKQVAVVLDEESMEALDNFGIMLNTSRSETIRQMVHYYIDHGPYSKNGFPE